ncbi:hypothetical protein GGR51DRAFT_530148 [Nemania sp. FL0031]|nr:hypothetical protein GGR51DRAFT_530148 [Nemania sp. FL0031]
MDPVSLTLAILPLLGGTIKVYGGLHKKFKSFCHSSREVYRARKHFDCQRQVFRNEIHLLLRPILEDELVILSMLDDPSHNKWESQELEDLLKKHLGQNYGTCLDIIKEIGSSNEELVGRMDCFNDGERQRQKGESIRATVRHLRDRTKVAWDKTKIDSSIANLRNSNEDLRLLRQQTIELQTSATHPRDMQKKVPQEYSEYKLIRRASKALHAALAAAWSNPAASCFGNKTRHDVKLFVDARVGNGVQMDMAVLCNSHTLHLAQPTMMRLRVNSHTVDWVAPGFHKPPCSDIEHQKRKVRFSDDTITLSALGSRERDIIPPLENSSVDLSQLKNLSGKDLCSTLIRDTLRPLDECSSICLGFIDNYSEETFRHSLYHVAEGRGYEPQQLVSMLQIMKRPIESSLSVVDQLKLARSLVAAVLKFHSTPWLEQYFALNNLSVFQSTPNLSICLQTLHFDANFGGASSRDGLESMSPSTLAVLKEIEEAKLHYGIRNLTLWCLGTILLQIGRWAVVDSPDDVLIIRKLSSQAPALGPRYQELTKRCLECDFGYGADLSNSRLQQAIYENVVCELTTMISSLDINA